MSSVTSVPICPKRFCGSNIFRVNPVFVLNLFERHSTGKAANYDPDRNAGAPYHGLAMANHRVNRDPIVVCHFAAVSFARTEVSARRPNHARTERGDQVDDVGITTSFPADNHRRPPPRHRNRREHCKQRVPLRSITCQIARYTQGSSQRLAQRCRLLDVQGDHILASDARQFARHLPRVLTDGEHMAAALVAHSQQRHTGETTLDNIRSKAREFTR